MKGTISLHERNNSCLRRSMYTNVITRREIMAEWGQLYADRFHTLHVIISPHDSIRLLTNPDGTNVHFGGRGQPRQNGFHFNQE